MKTKLRYFLPLYCIVFIFLLHSCSKAPPSTDISNQTVSGTYHYVPTAITDYSTLTKDQLQDSFNKAAGSLTPIEFNYDSYTTFQPTWILQFNSFWAYYRNLNGIQPVVGSFDCISFSLLYQALGQTAGIPYNHVNNALPIGILVVDQLKPWGGVSPEKRGGNFAYHAVITIFTTQGWYVIEPQTGMICKMADYPNRANINQLRI